MTHFQEVFVRNLRFYRTKAGFSQLTFSEKIELSPNYLNAIENGKNFPSAEVIQKILNELKLRPYQLFLELPETENQSNINELNQLAEELKRRVTDTIDSFIEKEEAKLTQNSLTS